MENNIKGRKLKIATSNCVLFLVTSFKNIFYNLPTILL